MQSRGVRPLHTTWQARRAGSVLRLDPTLLSSDEDGVTRVVRTRTSCRCMLRSNVTARLECSRLPSILPGAFVET